MTRDTEKEWITENDVNEVREFVRGMFAGIAVSGKTRLEVLEEEYWFNWNANIEIHVYKCDETDAWKCTAYQCNEYNQYFGNDYKVIDLGEKWQ